MPAAEAATEPVVAYAVEDGVARIHLNRPHRLNAVTAQLAEQLRDALRRAGSEAVGGSADRGVRAVVLAGRGRAFCAGHDLKEPVPVETAEQTRERLEVLQDITRACRDFPGVVVAAVQGYALGAGCEFALGCDLVVAGEDARFGFPEVGVGLSVTGGISAVLPKVVGPARAKELLVLGEHLKAATALELGLVNRVVPAGTHEEAAVALAAEAATRPATSTRLAKQVLDHGLDATVEDAMALEVEHAMVTATSGEGAAPRSEFTGG